MRMDFGNLRHAQFVLINIFTKDIDYLDSHETILGEVRGAWSGFIYIREIIGQKFVFLGRYRLVVNKDSLLHQVIRKMFSEGQHYKIIALIKKLELAHQGIIDESISEYIK